MLKDKDRIFQNLYNDLGSDVSSSQKRGDWVNTKDITDKGRDWIINEIKSSELRGRGGSLELVSFKLFEQIGFHFNSFSFVITFHFD